MLFISGLTASKDFPLTANAPDFSCTRDDADSCGIEAFVTVFDPNSVGAAALQLSTFLGGSKNESSFSSPPIVDSLGRVAVIGRKESTDFPLTDDAFDAESFGRFGVREFFALLDPSGSTDSALSYATLWGGGFAVGLPRLAQGPNHSFVLSMLATSADLPTTQDTFDQTCGFGGIVDFDHCVRNAYVAVIRSGTRPCRASGATSDFN